ncbi:hypothetical protein K505DRAFT_253434 [Melanomma pulvis-pyrius CBS 109.77]|uniref:Uncharacterized protein n=1 Tax=Melanomma pulvis-pyrius CBS 109.77 TaxID=1314802 RepID=A0A6A6WZM7_9PLEO|nr:hypothetical protein K505DRAFT_253434 [Melanomma pulvis-pyrius CBS 109.77]
MPPLTAIILSNKRNKRRVYVSIHHRDELSLGENRVRLGYEAFHWGILITPKSSRGPDSLAFDIFDVAVLDPISRQDTNPNRNWIFRPKTRVDSMRSGRLLGRVLIGKVPNNTTDVQIQSVLATVPVPVNGATPQQSCVTWTLAAVAALQNAGLARQFDVSQFTALANSYADRWLAAPNAHNRYDYAVGSQ